MSTYSLRSKGKAEPFPELSVDMKRAASKKKSTTKRAPKKTKQDSKETKKEEKEELTSEILEKGFVYFFYKPKVDSDEVNSIDDVQRLFIVMWPQGHMYKKNEPTTASRNYKRIIAIPKKSLPDEKKHSRYFGFVEKVSQDISEIDKDLNSRDYETKTKGSRHLDGARPVGEGIYSLISHGPHTHFVYVLELPKEIGEVQKAMHIAQEGSMIITVKNPEKTTKKFEYPENLQKLFEGRSYNPVSPPALLDYEGAEIILIGASDDLVAELGEVGEEVERYSELDAKRLTDDKLYKELHLNIKDHPIEPLRDGTWI